MKLFIYEKNLIAEQKRLKKGYMQGNISYHHGRYLQRKEQELYDKQQFLRKLLNEMEKKKNEISRHSSR